MSELLSFEYYYYLVHVQSHHQNHHVLIQKHVQNQEEFQLYFQDLALK